MMGGSDRSIFGTPIAGLLLIMGDDVLANVANLSAGFEEHVVCRRVSFQIPRRSALALLGPSGVGKSTLLRTLGRWNDLRPSFWVHGAVYYQGKDLLRELPAELVHRRFALLQQKARLFTATVLENAIAGVREDRQLSAGDKMDLAHEVLSEFQLWDRLSERLSHPVTSLPLAEQRMLALARLGSGGTECLLADEPLRDVEEEMRGELMDYLLFIRERMSLVFITHNQSVARHLADHVVLLVDGTSVESGPAAAFFEQPQTELGRRYRATGNCWPSEEEQDPEWAAHQKGESSPSSPSSRPVRPSWAPTAYEKIRRPGGFHWIQEDLLGGTQWPGLLQKEESDLKGLAALGVRHLVNLTEKPFPQDRLIALGMHGLHFPIADMSIPEIEECLRLCGRVARWLKLGEATVFHCRAGLGRTGTLLACMGIYGGDNAVAAIERVRRVNNKYIQSQEQLDFVSEFYQFLQKDGRLKSAG